eukprot:6829056-Prymnesium_polylepis.1
MERRPSGSTSAWSMTSSLCSQVRAPVKTRNKSPHPVSLSPVYIRLTATSQLTSIHSLTP